MKLCSYVAQAAQAFTRSRASVRAPRTRIRTRCWWTHGDWPACSLCRTPRESVSYMCVGRVLVHRHAIENAAHAFTLHADALRFAAALRAAATPTRSRGDEEPASTNKRFRSVNAAVACHAIENAAQERSNTHCVNADQMHRDALTLGNVRLRMFTGRATDRCLSTSSDSSQAWQVSVRIYAEHYAVRLAAARALEFALYTYTHRAFATSFAARRGTDAFAQAARQQ
jgi:hypothetical protein